MSWLRYGWGNVQPQSTMVESLASSKEMPKQTQWYHSKQVRHCTISLRLECWVLNPRQNTQCTTLPWQKGAYMVEGVSLFCKWQPDDDVLYHTAPDSSQCCCIGFFKKPASKVTCKSSLKKCGCQYCNANLPGETS